MQKHCALRELFDPVGDVQVHFRKTEYNEMKREVALSGAHHAGGHSGFQKRRLL
jgi:hypothetical protein